MTIQLDSYAEVWLAPNVTEMKIDLAWVDFETSGLEDDPNAMPLEVGCILTDKDGNEAASFRSLIFGPGWFESLQRAPEIVREMHSANGLANAMGGLSSMMREPTTAEQVLGYPQVDENFSDFLYQYGGASRVVPMAGSTINFDRFFMRYLPMSKKWFHYRNVDVSSYKNACRLYNPGLYAKLPQMPVDQKAHRPLEDLRESIKELQFYRDNFFFTE